MKGANPVSSAGVCKIVFGGALALLAVMAAQGQAAPPPGDPAAGGQPAGAAGAGGQMKNANEKLVTAVQRVDGTYAVDLVLPAWTVHNYLTLCSDGNKLIGNLREKADGKFLNNLSDAALNNSGFVFHVQVGPGGLDFAGSADGKTITGRVTIDGKYSEFKGVLADKKFDCTGK